VSDPSWRSVQDALAGRDTAALLELLRELYERSAENRRLVAARVLGADERARIGEYRARVATAFDPADETRPPRLAAARKAIREYRKTTADPFGTAELMLLYLEGGARLARAHPEAAETPYPGLEAVLRDLEALLRDAPAARDHFRERLEALREQARRGGWSGAPRLVRVVGDLLGG
jgi:hypothetical protein